MNKIDSLDLDGHLLKGLITIFEEGSITRAAERLGLTQSAVSHMLERLRTILGDPLFVKSGRGIAPTAQVGPLVAQARTVLAGLEQFRQFAPFEPAQLDRTLTIAANPLQRDLLLPRLFQALRKEAPKLRLRVIPSEVPSVERLRGANCDLVITPRPPVSDEIKQRLLFQDSYAVYYDRAKRAAPQNLTEYLEAEHITVVYESGRTLDIDAHIKTQGIERRFAIEVAAFDGVRPFLKGSPYLVTLPTQLAVNQLAGFAQAPVPLPCPVLPMYAVWHQRNHTAPLLRWVLDRLLALLGPSATAGE